MCKIPFFCVRRGKLSFAKLYYFVKVFADVFGTFDSIRWSNMAVNSFRIWTLSWNIARIRCSGRHFKTNQDCICRAPNWAKFIRLFVSKLSVSLCADIPRYSFGVGVTTRGVTRRKKWMMMSLRRRCHSLRDLMTRFASTAVARVYSFDR